MIILKVRDRKSGKIVEERVYGGGALAFLYSSSALGRFFLKWVARVHLFSVVYGFWQKMPWTRRKIKPFIEAYGVDEGSFLEPACSYTSFNDFFCRKLKKEARPIFPDARAAILPADGRYLAYQNIENADGFIVKGKKFSLQTLLGSEKLASEYSDGSIVFGRLCPFDYHRFHFPVDCVPGKPRLLNGALHSVNPFATSQNLERLAENKRVLTELESVEFGKVLFIDVGAINVGSITQTFIPGKMVLKGDEKGFFSFGGSLVILLFQKGKILIADDLLEASKEHLEVVGLMGDLLGNAP